MRFVAGLERSVSEMLISQDGMLMCCGAGPDNCWSLRLVWRLFVFLLTKHRERYKNTNLLLDFTFMPSIGGL